MARSMADLVQWQENTTANVPETMSGAKIAWRLIDEEKGRGVFALRNFKKGEILEVSPVIPVAKRNLVESGEAPDGYLLQWDSETEDEEYCMPLGYVMMYNHSPAPNIWIECDTGEYKMTVIALRDIDKDEELCWDYSCEIWFDQE